MKIFIKKNQKEADKKAFEIIKKQVLAKPNSLIGLAVGKTTDNIYKLICKDLKKNKEIWKKIRLFQIDENMGFPPKSKSSFNYEIRKELKPLLKIIDKKNIFLINGMENSKKIILKAYKFIKQNKGIDLIILGIGPEYDPHIAYNTKGQSSVNSRMRVVNLHPLIAKKIIEKSIGVSGYRGIGVKGITLGIKDILDSKKALLIAYGKEKAKSIQIAFRKVDTKRTSASALLLHKDLIVVLDKDAGKLLADSV